MLNREEKHAARYAEENAARTAAALQWRDEGHTMYAYHVKAPATYNGGPLLDISREMESVESAGWNLDQMAWSKGVIVMLLFRRSG